MVYQTPLLANLSEYRRYRGEICRMILTAPKGLDSSDIRSQVSSYVLEHSDSKVYRSICRAAKDLCDRLLGSELVGVDLV